MDFHIGFIEQYQRMLYAHEAQTQSVPNLSHFLSLKLAFDIPDYYAGAYKVSGLHQTSNSIGRRSSRILLRFRFKCRFDRYIYIAAELRAAHHSLCRT